MNYTTIEQSKKLLEAGLDPESADMAWIDRPLRVTDCPEVPVIMDIELESMIPQNKLIPCYSVGKLISLLPDRIMHNELNCECFMTPHSVGYSSTFSNEKGFFNIVWHKNPNFIDALFNAIVWLLENNYIK